MRSKGRFPFSSIAQFIEPRKCLDSEYVLQCHLYMCLFSYALLTTLIMVSNVAICIV